MAQQCGAELPPSADALAPQGLSLGWRPGAAGASGHIR